MVSSTSNSSIPGPYYLPLSPPQDTTSKKPEATPIPLVIAPIGPTTADPALSLNFLLHSLSSHVSRFASLHHAIVQYSESRHVPSSYDELKMVLEIYTERRLTELMAIPEVKNTINSAYAQLGAPCYIATPTQRHQILTLHNLATMMENRVIQQNVLKHQ